MVLVLLVMPIQKVEIGDLVNQKGENQMTETKCPHCGSTEDFVFDSDMIDPCYRCRECGCKVNEPVAQGKEIPSSIAKLIADAKGTQITKTETQVTSSFCPSCQKLARIVVVLLKVLKDMVRVTTEYDKALVEINRIVEEE